MVNPEIYICPTCEQGKKPRPRHQPAEHCPGTSKTLSENGLRLGMEEQKKRKAKSHKRPHTRHDTQCELDDIGRPIDAPEPKRDQRNRRAATREKRARLDGLKESQSQSQSSTKRWPKFGTVEFSIWLLLTAIAETEPQPQHQAPSSEMPILPGRVGDSEDNVCAEQQSLLPADPNSSAEQHRGVERNIEPQRCIDDMIPAEGATDANIRPRIRFKSGTKSLAPGKTTVQGQGSESKPRSGGAFTDVRSSAEKTWDKQAKCRKSRYQESSQATRVWASSRNVRERLLQGLRICDSKYVHYYHIRLASLILDGVEDQTSLIQKADVANMLNVLRTDCTARQLPLPALYQTL
jgi:hypothetical protein